MSSGDVMYTSDLLLWAGYNGDDEYYFLVNGDGRTQVRGTFRVFGTMYYNDEDLEDYIRDIVQDEIGE
jgi:hypothetical protein